MRFAKAPEAFETCDREDEAVDHALPEAAQPGIDVAANIHGPQIRADGGDLRGSTRAPGADAGPRRELPEGSALARNQRIARVRAREKRGEHQPGRRNGRKILRRVDRELGPAVEQRLLELLYEDALARRVTEPHRRVTIAMRRQRREYELVLRVDTSQSIRGKLRLDHRQRAASRRQPKSHRGPS